MSANMTGRQFKVMGQWQNAGEEGAVWEVVEDRGDRVLAKLVSDKPLPIEPTEVVQKFMVDWLPERMETKLYAVEPIDDANERVRYAQGSDAIMDDETLDEYLGRMAKVWHPEELKK